jgi:hypothetical protein
MALHLPVLSLWLFKKSLRRSQPFSRIILLNSQLLSTDGVDNYKFIFITEEQFKI